MSRPSYMFALCSFVEIHCFTKVFSSGNCSSSRSDPKNSGRLWCAVIMERHVSAYIRKIAVEKLLQLMITICLKLQMRICGSADASEVPADLEEGMVDDQLDDEQNNSRRISWMLWVFCWKGCELNYCATGFWFFCAAHWTAKVCTSALTTGLSLIHHTDQCGCSKYTSCGSLSRMKDMHVLVMLSMAYFQMTYSSGWLLGVNCFWRFSAWTFWRRTCRAVPTLAILVRSWSSRLSNWWRKLSSCPI